MVHGDLRYTKDHEWIRFKAGAGIVGITDYAQRVLGDITRVELPQVGRKAGKHCELGVVESVKAASDIFSPVAGTVAEVNLGLGDKPELINLDPYGMGWICRLEGVNEDDVTGLLTAGEYEALTSKGE